MHAYSSPKWKYHWTWRANFELISLYHNFDLTNSIRRHTNKTGQLPPANTHRMKDKISIRLAFLSLWSFLVVFVCFFIYMWSTLETRNPPFPSKPLVVVAYIHHQPRDTVDLFFWGVSQSLLKHNSKLLLLLLLVRSQNKEPSIA